MFELVPVLGILVAIIIPVSVFIWLYLESKDRNKTILEISTFEAKGQTFQASVGNNDDLVMNLVLFGYFVSSAYFSDLTDINIKDVIFNQKMKEIQEDIVPFGFIDDGTEHMKTIENKEDQWQIEYDRDL